MREIVHIQAGQCGNQIGAKVRTISAFPGDQTSGGRRPFSNGNGKMEECSSATRGKVKRHFWKSAILPSAQCPVREYTRFPVPTHLGYLLARFLSR